MVAQSYVAPAEGSQDDAGKQQLESPVIIEIRRWNGMFHKQCAYLLAPLAQKHCSSGEPRDALEATCSLAQITDGSATLRC